MCGPGSVRTEALIRPEQLPLLQCAHGKGGQAKARLCSDIKQRDHTGVCSELCMR